MVLDYLLRTPFLLQVHNGDVIFNCSLTIKPIEFVAQTAAAVFDMKCYTHTYHSACRSNRARPIFPRSYFDCQRATCKLNPFKYLWLFWVRFDLGYWMLRRIVHKQAFNLEISCKNESVFQLWWEIGIKVSHCWAAMSGDRMVWRCRSRRNNWLQATECKARVVKVDRSVFIN